MLDDIEDWGFVVVNGAIIVLHFIENASGYIGTIAVIISVAYCVNSGLEVIAHRRRIKEHRKEEMK